MNASHPTLQRIFKSQVRYAAVMTIIAFVMGLIYREFSRPFFRALLLEERLRYGHFMELVHGHTFLLGAAIPLLMAVLTYLTAAQLQEKDLAQMQVRFKAYIGASAAALVLMVYKGMAFIVGAGQPLDTIDAGLFFGSHLLRGILFGAAHLTLFWAAGEYLFRFFRATRTSQAA